MTSASELFYTRRSRSGRTSLDLGFDSSLDRTFHHHSNTQRRHHHHHQHHNTPRRERHDFDACDPPRRTPVTRHHSHRSSNSDRDTVRPDGSRFEPGGSNIMNVDNSGGLRGSMRPSGNDRLPGAVILARERLLQRLRGVSLSGNRERNHVPSGISRNNITSGDDFRLVDAGDWEMEFSMEGFTDSTLFIDPTDETLMPQTSKRSPGLTVEDLNRLQVEIFQETECSRDDVTCRTLKECSICLENFVAGDDLTCLPCGHRFHKGCLDPWIRSCGDCPYCRSDIVVVTR